MGYEIISGDSHIDLTWLPSDLFTSSAPAHWKDRMPRVVETEQGLRWQDSKGIELAAVGGIGSLGRDPSLYKGGEMGVDRMIATGLYEDGAAGRLRPGTPDLRIKDQELDGVDAEVLYPILGLAKRLDDPEVTYVVYQIYNDWVAEFCKTNPQRFAGLACIPNNDPEVAAGELRRAAKLNLRGADFAVSTAVKPLYHRDWDVLWATSAECNMPVSFHASGIFARRPDPEDVETHGLAHRAASLSMFQLGGFEFLGSIIFSGACDRYPNFKFILGECGVAWIPYFLDRMDNQYENEFHQLNLSMKPSDFWRRQGFSTFQWEGFVADVAHLVGENNIMWGSDYPHPDGVWPESQQYIERDLGRLEPSVRYKIICENAGKLYGFIS